MESRKFYFTESQTAVLRRYYDEGDGVKSNSKQNASMIAKIATQIGAREEQVKV